MGLFTGLEKAGRSVAFRGIVTPCNAFRAQTAIWLDRLLDYDIPIDSRFFACAGWAIGSIEALSARVLRELPAPKGRTKEAAAIRLNLKKLRLTKAASMDDALEELYEEGPSAQVQLRNMIRQDLKLAGRNGASAMRKVMAPLGRLFGLDASALEVCALAFCMENFSEVDNYLQHTLEIDNFQNIHIRATLLNLSVPQYRKIHASLKNMGILDTSYGSFTLTENVDEAIREDACKTLKMKFCKPLKPTSVKLSQFRIDEADVNYVVSLLRSASRDPLHILLYGVPGSGKSSFASALAQELDLPAWLVPCEDDDSPEARRVALAACLKLAERHPGGFVLVDEAERLLDTDGSFESGSSQKAWLNELLERKGVRVIWISNQVHHIDQAVRRRFSYSIYFDELRTDERRQMWLMTAERLHVRKKLTEKWLDHFVATYPVPVATIENAIRQAKNMKQSKQLCENMDSYLASQMCLRHDGRWTAKKDSALAGYDPAAICTATPPDTLMRKIERLITTRETMHGMGSILFWGPPGTGKTAFARHIARSFKLDCKFYKASDILGPYVGQTEANIADMFAQAGKDTLLLVDEVDSFIAARDGAQHSWEQTMVNEFLTQLDGFEGICVCTTNFRNILDLAAMRRFSYKIEFTYAKAQQLRLLYSHILQPLVGSDPDETFLKRLCARKTLTPGDFHTVRMQYWLEDSDALTHELLLQALIKEERLKLEQSGQQLGFGSGS